MLIDRKSLDTALTMLEHMKTCDGIVQESTVLTALFLEWLSRHPEVSDVRGFLDMNSKLVLDLLPKYKARRIT